ncbi:hypothetical protein [Capnocytophaga stomatis]|uniref:hypothetical protein n=1 Tax=Capnocytophaga stomatis TaxID=1848904 RepID=UPI001AD3F4F6|nr:hypothetical protein [Capnocytophaga stomatis]GIM49441.1 hypothetical protein CAPN003_08930 [Capnocytophaga stomatis]
MSRLIEYIDVLKLDNFLQMLTFSERLQVSQYRAGRTDNVPEKVEKLQQWIDKARWKPPELKISQDREVLWFDLERQSFQPLKNHPLYKQKTYAL